MSIKEQATSVFWSAVERFSVQGIQFLLTIVIARILSPDDYGLVAMLGIFMALSQVLIDSGFANALIQKKNRSETDYSTVFYFNTVGSVLVYGFLFLCAPSIANFFDDHIFYDNKYNQIITTSDTKVATFVIDKNKCTINSSDVSLIAPAKKIGNEFYLPFSEISKSVYNVETKYISETNTVVLVSLDRELVYANSSKNNSVKYMPTSFSKTVDKIEKGDNVTVVKDDKTAENGWTKVTTENGKIGYVKTSTLANEKQIREKLNIEKQIEGNISLAWDYFSEYASAPQRTGTIKGVNVVSPAFLALQDGGKGNLVANVGTAGTNYINWAHNNGYKVWALLSNNSDKPTTTEILNDYKLREKLINNIVTAVVTFNLDGINLDFEYLNESDKDVYSRLVIELAPRLKELGKVLSVDVTAPDGSPDWSLCYDRNVIGDVADYIVFMGYDQNGVSSPKEGTTAGCDWVEANIKKFLGQEGVDASKIILGTPFYTRIWTENNGSVTSKVVNMKNIASNIPDGTKTTWDDSLKQNYAEYEKGGKTYKIWIEDAKSLRCKLELVNTYNLAGAAYWEKDRETDDIWDMVSEVLNVK